MAQCRAKTKSGGSCRAPATANGRCALHQGTGVARELAAKSVRARRRKAQAAKEADKIKVPKDSSKLVTELAKVFADLKCGELDVAIARAMASVATVLLSLTGHRRAS